LACRPHGVEVAEKEDSIRRLTLKPHAQMIPHLLCSYEIHLTANLLELASNKLCELVRQWFVEARRFQRDHLFEKGESFRELLSQARQKNVHDFTRRHFQSC